MSLLLSDMFIMYCFLLSKKREKKTTTHLQWLIKQKKNKEINIQ